MKKRSMKKYIPKGMYCHGPMTGIGTPTKIEGTEFLFYPMYEYRQHCKWWRCYTDKNGVEKYYCAYLGLTQEEGDMLWDKTKECFVKYNDK